MAGSGTAHLRDDALLTVRDLVVEFPLRDGGIVHAVSGISFDVLPGETLGLVGESGCGKSTTGRAIAGHVRPTGGTIEFADRDLASLDHEETRRLRSRLQMIFQDPISSLNPRRTAASIIGEGLRIWNLGDKDTRRSDVRQIMAAVGLDFDAAGGKRRHEFSGGQCQRISIARSLVLDPDLLICDEPVSALDVSVQAQILNLLEDMKERYDLTMIFISHDLSVIKHVSQRTVVMYLGKVCEIAPPIELYEQPLHPYTQTLLAAIPLPDPTRRAARLTADGRKGFGEVPSPIAPPSGCRFRTRCPRARDVCAEEEPTITELLPGHFVACHFPGTDSQ